MKSRLSILGCMFVLATLVLSALAVPANASSPGTYVVQPGDTLTGIAARYGLGVGQLARFNGLSWNSWVYVGQRLAIPGGQTPSEATYTVRWGDTLYSIARRFGTTTGAIMAANHLRSTLIYAGQVLAIPTQDPGPGIPSTWISYIHPEYGIGFQYPATWAIREEENLVKLEGGTLLLAIAFQRHGEDAPPPWTGMPAGDIVSRGKMVFLRQVIDKNALVYKGKVKLLTYAAEVGDLVVSIRLEDVLTADYDKIEIPEATQSEIDQIVGSFEMQSGTPTPPTPTPPSAIERIRFAAGATQATVEGYLSASGTAQYVMHVEGGQFIEVDASVGYMGQGLRFSIVGADGAVVKPMGNAHVRTVVPSTQDYYLRLVSDVGAVSYRMSVLIPVRIRFAPGAISAEIRGSLAKDGTRHYVLRALAGQRMIIAPESTFGQVGLIISGADGQVLLGGGVGVSGGVYDGILPTTQDYLITVRAKGESGAQYAMVITILPQDTGSDVTIVGRVMDASPSARTITLAEPVEGFSVVALTQAGRVISSDGQEILLRDIPAGARIQASGQPGASQALLANQIILLANG